MTATGQPDVRVLLVDDTGTLASAVRPCLERAGCEVVTSGDVGPALALVDAFMPDVVLVRRELPSGTAFDVLSSIRSDPRCAGTGVMIVMEDLDSAELLTALDLGADDFLCAPFKPVELLVRLQAVLRQRTLVTPARVAEARLAAAVGATAGARRDAGVGREGVLGTFGHRGDAAPASRSTVPHGQGGPFPPSTDTTAAPPADDTPPTAGEGAA